MLGSELAGEGRVGLERGELEVLDGHDATSFDPVGFEVHHSVRRRTADGSQCQGG